MSRGEQVSKTYTVTYEGYLVVKADDEEKFNKLTREDAQ
jgi:hypothetical protein